MLEKCNDCCSRLFCMSVAEVNGEDFETMANKKDCRKRVFTNADRIRAMSDEKLASWAKKQIGCGAGFFPCGVVCNGKCEAHSPEACRTLIMEWLKQPAEVEDA